MLPMVSHAIQENIVTDAMNIWEGSQRSGRARCSEGRRGRTAILARLKRPRWSEQRPMMMRPRPEQPLLWEEGGSARERQARTI